MNNSHNPETEPNGKPYCRYTPPFFKTNCKPKTVGAEDTGTGERDWTQTNWRARPRNEDLTTRNEKPNLRQDKEGDNRTQDK